MAKGGHARSGPAPDPRALRRERPSDRDGWTTLPSEGRPGDPPKWPLPELSDRESELWSRLWVTPQAVVWERFGQQLEVALYVRRLVEAERRDSPVALSTLVRQMSDSLGLTTPGLRSNRWTIAADEVAAKRSTRKAPAKKTSSRSRLKVAPSADGA